MKRRIILVTTILLCVMMSLPAGLGGVSWAEENTTETIVDETEAETENTEESDVGEPTEVPTTRNQEILTKPQEHIEGEPSDSSEPVPQKQETTADFELQKQEPVTDAGNHSPWELKIYFNDAEVSAGNTPLEEIDWNASDGGCGDLAGKAVRVTIVYRCVGADTDYPQGTVNIKIPNLMYNQEDWSSSDSRLDWTLQMGANDDTHSGFDWTLQSAYTDEYFEFTNAETFSADTNFEGEITFEYELKPVNEFNKKSNEWSPYQDVPYDEYNVNSCVHELHKRLQAKLSIREVPETVSNEITFDYYREYIHPWEKKKYRVYKSASKLASNEGLKEDFDDYFWVRYSFSTNANYEIFSLNRSSRLAENYPYIPIYKAFFEDTFPNECKVLDYKYEELAPESVGESESRYYFKPRSGYATADLIVGYPKNIYNLNAQNLDISNTV